MHSNHSLIIEFDLEHHTHRIIPIDELSINAHDKHKIYWVHSDLNNSQAHERIAMSLSLPTELLALCQQQDNMPVLIDTDDSLTLQIQCIKTNEIKKNKNLSFDTLTLYLTQQFCFTASYDSLSVISTFIKSYDKALKYAKTPCFILFLLLDYTVNDYAQMLFQFEIQSDAIQKHIQHQHKNTYNDIMQSKQRLIHLKRNIVATREMITKMSGHQISVISPQCRSSLINLSNHNQMVAYEADSIQDMLNGYLDQLDNALMHKLSETMKILTLLSAIFLPLTLIAGIYGMNFQWIPELSWKYGYFYALGLIAGCAILFILIFKKMKWF